MTRRITTAAAQLGPIARKESRAQVVGRLIALLQEAKRQGADLVVFPELALTSFFPRWYFEDERELDSFFETEMPNPAARPLFEEARRLGIAFYLGYAELTEEGGAKCRYNTAIVVDKTGAIVGKYRKVHLPGHWRYEPERPFQHLEKRYFMTGNLGFPVFDALGARLGMCICNDRRWPEAYRVMGLQGVEMVLIGYNTPAHYPPAPELDRLQDFHNHLVMQSGAYQNGTWVVGVAKAGREEGCDLIGRSCIITPTGEIVAETKTLGDELALAECDLDAYAAVRRTIMNLDIHREPASYGIITEPKKPFSLENVST